MTGTQQFEHAMKALGAKFSGELPHKLQEIRHLYFAATQSAHDDASLNRLYLTLHGLAGAARTFGHPHICDAARGLELCVAEAMRSGQAPASASATLQLAMDKFLHACVEQMAA